MLIENRDFAGARIAGARPYQEDAQNFASLEEGKSGEVLTLLTVLADGMGGENAGNVASESVVNSMIAHCLQTPSPPSIPKMLRTGMQLANDHLLAQIQENPALDGMGCTLLATVVSEGSLYWISVGDSPLYLYRDGCLTQLNEDHSMMPLLLQQVEEGELDASELSTHPDRNVLRSAMTGDEIELVDCPSDAYPLMAGDILLVASDGLQTLDEKALERRLEWHQNLPADDIVSKLMAAVKKVNHPKQDNTSINVICIPDPAKIARMELDEESLNKTVLIRRKSKNT
jgi:serine/threonine protein phosphatase PrpC